MPTTESSLSANDTAPGTPGAFLCSEAGGVVTCTGGTLDGSLDLVPGVPQTRHVHVVVTAPMVQDQLITNQAFIDPSNAIPESNETNNQDSDSTHVTSPFNLTLDKQGPDTAHQNNEEDYVLTVTNEGKAVNDVVVVDALPVGLIPLSFQTEGNFICNLTENPVNGVRCVGDMAAGPGTTAKITIHVFVTANGGALDNEACVDPDNAVIESNENDNCSTKTTVVNKFSPDISIQKTADKDTTTIGDTLTYTVTASNVGDAPTDTGWTVKDTLPSVVSFVNAVATNGVTCTNMIHARRSPRRRSTSRSASAATATPQLATE